jgi:hypothetical protein
MQRFQLLNNPLGPDVPLAKAIQTAAKRSIAANKSIKVVGQFLKEITTRPARGRKPDSICHRSEKNPALVSSQPNGVSAPLGIQEEIDLLCRGMSSRWHGYLR